MLLPVLLGETRGLGTKEAPTAGNPVGTSPAPNPEPAGPPTGLFKKTMIGMAPGATRQLNRQPAEAPAPGDNAVTPAPGDSAVNPAPVDQETMSPARPAPAHFQTMLGVAPPAPTKAPSNEAKQTLMGAGSFAKPEANQLPPFATKKETLIGVAIPGIAPVSPGVDKSRGESSVEQRVAILRTRR